MKTGDLVGARFRIENRVGAGGMGVVFRARDEMSGKWVAIKLFSWRNAIEVQRAQREVAVLARLAHPAIVAHVADGVTPTGELFLAMDWVDGETVADRLDATGFSVREAVAMTHAIAGALEVAHGAGVLHRDIKPTNVVLAGGDPAAARLIDFGVARVAEAKALTRTGLAIGTPGYMSPEQARGERELTAAADVFGLGCLLYECISGRPAFSGSLAAAVMAKVLFATPPSLAELAIPAPLLRLIDRMLAKDLADRVADCGQVRAELAALESLPDSPRRGTRSLATVTAPIAAVATHPVHCIVGAAQGSPDDLLDPPGAEAIAELVVAAERHQAELEVFATGAVVAHLRGALRPTATRAADLALAVRAILPGWSITLSAVMATAESAIDAGTILMTQAALAAIFRKPDRDAAIVVDPHTARVLAEDFELAAGAEPCLIGRKR